MVVTKGTGGKLSEKASLDNSYNEEAVGDEVDEDGEIDLGEGVHIAETDDSGFAEDIDDSTDDDLTSDEDMEILDEDEINEEEEA